jgi:L-fucose mutarotase/ribose pyranase (RbsD/FucU family)
MSEDKKDKSINSFGIYIGHGEKNVFSEVEISGHNTGMYFDTSINNTFNKVKIISLDALKIIEETQAKLVEMEIDKGLHQQVQDQLDAIKNATDKESAKNSYMKMISCLSDHVTVLTPVLPQLFLLASNLLG